MKRAMYVGVGALVALTTPALAQQSSKSDAVGDQTMIAVQLASQSHATGNATFTKTKDGILVKVTTPTSPTGNQVAVVRKGTCAGSGMGMKSGGDAGSMSNGSMSNGSTSSGSMSNGSMSGGSTSGGTGSMTTNGTAMKGATAYQIGPLSVAQGDQGQPIGAAQTTLKGVSLTQLVSGGYAVAIVDPKAGSNAGAMCGDLNNALAPTTPATVNKSQ